MKQLAIAGLALACLILAACAPMLAATPPGGSPPTGLERFEGAIGMSYATYCALPEITRQAIRARLTKGLPVVVCIGDLLPVVGPEAAP